MSKLYVIEAPGKARTMESMLQKIGQEGRVQATKGHLFELPDLDQGIGVDSAFRDFERKPRDQKVVDRLRAEALIATEVYIATDADSEGDVIAWDVAELIRDMHPRPYRIRLRGMDEASIRAAFQDASPVSKRDAVAGRTRAIVDRMIGMGFSKPGLSVGRVGTALLGLIDKTQPSVHKLKLAAPAKDGGRPFTAEVEVKAPIDREVASALVKLDLPALQLAKSDPVKTLPGNMGDAMVRAGDELDLSPKEAEMSLQRLYEAGQMSYPRAGSRGISPSVAHAVAEVLRKAGYKVDGVSYAKKDEGSVHDAPHPIGKDIDAKGDPRKLGHDEGVRALVTRDLVKAGQQHTMDRPVVTNLWPYLVGKGFSQEVADVVVRLNWGREVGPRYPGQESWPTSTIMTRRADTVVLEAAVAAGLGRPSTWAKHVTQFVERGLVTEDLRITAKGRDWIARSPKELLDPRVSIAIEQACEKFRDAYMDDPEREPWELNAERIVRALPPQIQGSMIALVKDEPPHPKIDPVLAYGQAPDVLASLPETTRAPAYAPAHLDD